MKQSSWKIIHKICWRNWSQSLLRNWNWTYLWISNLKFYTLCFYVCPSWGLSKYIEMELQITCFYLILGCFKKIKYGLELVSLPHFLNNFWKTMILLLYSINWQFHLSKYQVSLSGCLYFVRYWAMCVLELLVNQVVTKGPKIIFKINKKYWSKNHFLSFLKGFQWSK